MSQTAFGADLTLTRSQEGLLRTALSSNTDNLPHKPLPATFGNPLSRIEPQQLTTGSMSNSTNMYTSPIQQAPGSGQLDSFDESPFLDYDNLEDGNFDWENSGDQLFGDLPGTDYNEEGEHHDKRKASVDEEDEVENSSKRREGDDKTPKKTGQKPGRKPLTGEPTTKRKAQNRAAQRAFRERKERHLKDLETKVEDLEKASETANHENGRLRATVDKLQTELKEYRKRLSMNVRGAGYSPPQSATRGYSNSSNGNDFSFAFPKFGDLPGSFMNNGSMAKTTSPTQSTQSTTTTTNTNLRKDSSSSIKAVSPTGLNSIPTPQSTASPSRTFLNGVGSNAFDELDGLFSPSILENASRSASVDYLSHSGSNASLTNGAAQKPFVAQPNGQSQPPAARQQSTTSIGSPASSMSHALDSSCGTTPESSGESPDLRKGSESNLNTISEEGKAQKSNEAISNVTKPPIADVNGFDWMAQQNGGQFDPVLFGDYRDPQDNILNTSFDGYFNDAFPFNDFASPYNTAEPLVQTPKKDFMQEIEVRQKNSPGQLVPGDEKQEYYSCPKLRDAIASSGKVNTGEFDIDNLCSQFKEKAKCTKGGAIAQKDVNEILGQMQAEQTDFSKMFS